MDYTADWNINSYLWLMDYCELIKGWTVNGQDCPNWLTWQVTSDEFWNTINEYAYGERLSLYNLTQEESGKKNKPEMVYC